MQLKTEKDNPTEGEKEGGSMVKVFPGETGLRQGYKEGTRFQERATLKARKNSIRTAEHGGEWQEVGRDLIL